MYIYTRRRRFGPVRYIAMKHDYELNGSCANYLLETKTEMATKAGRDAAELADVDKARTCGVNVAAGNRQAFQQTRAFPQAA